MKADNEDNAENLIRATKEKKWDEAVGFYEKIPPEKRKFMDHHRGAAAYGFRGRQSQKFQKFLEALKDLQNSLYALSNMFPEVIKDEKEFKKMPANINKICGFVIESANSFFNRARGEMIPHHFRAYLKDFLKFYMDRYKFFKENQIDLPGLDQFDLTILESILSPSLGAESRLCIEIYIAVIKLFKTDAENREQQWNIPQDFVAAAEAYQVYVEAREIIARFKGAPAQPQPQAAQPQPVQPQPAAAAAERELKRARSFSPPLPRFGLGGMQPAGPPSPFKEPQPKAPSPIKSALKTPPLKTPSVKTPSVKPPAPRTVRFVQDMESTSTEPTASVAPPPPPPPSSSPSTPPQLRTYSKRSK